MSKPKTNLFYLGLAIPLIFWATLFVCGMYWENYSHLRNMVSELGELGSRTQYLFAAGLCLCGVLTLPFGVLLIKSCKDKGVSILPVVFVFAFVFIVGPGIFPYPTYLHGITGMPAFLVILSPIIAIVFWRKTATNRFKITAYLCIILFLLGSTVYYDGFMNEYFGLKQRFFHLGWSVWFAWLGWYLQSKPVV